MKPEGGRSGGEMMDLEQIKRWLREYWRIQKQYFILLLIVFPLALVLALVEERCGRP